MQPPHPKPAWRTTEVGPAQPQDLVNVMQMTPTSNTSPAFVTHFMQRKTPATILIKMIGATVSEENDVSLYQRKVEIRQLKKIRLFGLEITLKNELQVIFMHHVAEAMNDGKNMNLMMADHRVEFTGLCRPIAFTQAINRMLASASTPPSENCSSCRHYQRWQTKGNQGECTIRPPETQSGLPPAGQPTLVPPLRKALKNAAQK